MKGEMFLIVAILTILVISLLHITSNLKEIAMKKEFVESGLESLEFENLKRELKKIV